MNYDLYFFKKLYPFSNIEQINNLIQEMEEF